MTLAPIIIFAYNRPEHLRQTLDALARNGLAKDSMLYIYCDGPKANATDEMKQSIAQVQTVAKNYAVEAQTNESFQTVQVVCAEKNKGLANSIIDGVTEVIDKHGRVIVLEDDLLTSPYFLRYMNSALEFYQEHKSVFSISANRPPMSKLQIPADYPYDVFVSLRSFSTGWATWSDRWSRVDWTLDYLSNFLTHSEQTDAFNRAGDDMTEMLLMQRDGKIDSWAIRFSFAHFREHAVAILPCVPYVDNIGFDGTGIHSGTETNNLHRNNLSLSVAEPKMPEVLYEDARIVNAFYNVYCRKKRPLWQRLANTIARKLGKDIPFTIKKKIYLQ